MDASITHDVSSSAATVDDSRTGSWDLGNPTIPSGLLGQAPRGTSVSLKSGPPETTNTTAPKPDPHDRPIFPTARSGRRLCRRRAWHELAIYYGSGQPRPILVEQPQISHAIVQSRHWGSPQLLSPKARRADVPCLHCLLRGVCAPYFQERNNGWH